jgi:hypothetical protein
MNSTIAARRPGRRSALAAGLTLVLGLGVTAQASAGGPRTVSGNPSDPVTRIADFYGAYIDARTDPDRGGRLAEELRGYYLTAAFHKQLKTWETKNGADGVLRAQNVPVRWEVTGEGTDGYTGAGVTLTWADGKTTRLVVEVTRSHRINRIGIGGPEGS